MSEECSSSSESGLSSPYASTSLTSTKKKRNKRFRYGNFNRYSIEKGLLYDPRLDLLPKEWFNNKRILDIGCNVGHLTLVIAKKLSPSLILGIDIDDNLIDIAKKNIKHYFGFDKGQKIIGKFPASKKEYNVRFSHENYVLESDEDLEMVQEEYDIILALSISKWIHLNWGDEGIKRFFKRIWKHLKQGGRLLLEIQDWSKYHKAAKKIPDMLETYENIKFKPNQFKDYLINDVGFVECQELCTSNTVIKGFEMSMLVFHKVTNLNKRKRKRINDSQSGSSSLDFIKVLKEKFMDVKECTKITITDPQFNGLSVDQQKKLVMNLIPEDKRNDFELETRAFKVNEDRTVKQVKLRRHVLISKNSPATAQQYLDAAVYHFERQERSLASEDAWHAGCLQIKNFMLQFDLDPKSQRITNEIVFYLRHVCLSTDETLSEKLGSSWISLLVAITNSYNNYCNLNHVYEFLISCEVFCNIINQINMANIFNPAHFLEYLEGDYEKDLWQKRNEEWKSLREWRRKKF